MLLVLRHEPFEHLGYFAEILEETHYPFNYSNLGDPISLNGHTGIIVMGGPQSANDDTTGLRAEMDLIQGAIRQKIPVLGICLGAQIIAKSLGAIVYRNPVKEIGWEPVHFTEQASKDPVLGGLPSP